MRKRRPFPAALVLVVALAVGFPGPALADEPDRVPVARLTDTWADKVLRNGTDTGPADPSTAVTAQVFLTGDAAGLAAYARAVSDPADPRYRRFLTPDRTRARFGPAQQRIDAVTAWLRGTGLTVDRAGPRGVVVHGTVAQAAVAFGTRFRNYTFFGSPFRAAIDPITVPASVGADVLAITGLTIRTGPPSKPGTSGAESALRTAARQAGAPVNPCPGHFGDTPVTDLPPAYGHPVQWAPCGYTPKQVRDAYGITGTGLTGKDVTIGIIGTSYEANALVDANRIAAELGEPTFAPGQFTAHVPAGATPEPTGGECTMDIEAAHAMAPEANIAYVVGTGSAWGDSVLDTITEIVDEHLADVVSGSYFTGHTPDSAPDAIAAYERAFQEAAVEGITFTFASGDSGGGIIDGKKTVEYPPSSPWVTAVGGTSLGIGAGNRRLWEIVWATDYTKLSADSTRWDPEPPGYQGKATGGGTSAVFGQPFYQRGVVPTAFAGSPPMRTVPDVSALADYHLGLRIGITEDDVDHTIEYVRSNGGGTSLSSPLFAGIEALLVQKSGPLGFANPALYARGGTFHCVGDNPAGTPNTIAYALNEFDGVVLSTPGQYADAALEFARGYDTSTGLGTPTRALIDSFRPRG